MAGDGDEPGLQPRHASVEAKQTIYRGYQLSGDVILIREGWAARVVTAGNGRRFIQSFLLPGDPLSTTSFFSERLPFSVRSVTPVSYCIFDRRALLARLESRPESLRLISDICVEDRKRCDRQMLDAITRSAEERVAILLLDLFDRTNRSGATEDEVCTFPLTQQQIADALGITDVHVNRVLRRLRESGLVESSSRATMIAHVAGLREIARGA